MKRIKWIIAALMLSVMVLGTVSCTENNGIQEPVGDSMLTPDEHKAKLDQIGADLAGYINVNDYKDVILSLTALAEYTSQEGDVSPYNINGFAMSLLNVVESRNPANMMAFAAAPADYVYSIDMLLDMLYQEGIIDEKALGVQFVYNKGAMMWDILPLDERAFVLKWDNSELRLEYSEATTTYRVGNIPNITDETVDVIVPNEIKGSLKIGGIDQISLNFKPNISNDGLTVEPEISLTIVNLDFFGKMSATPEYIGGEFSLSKAGTELISVYSKIAIDNFTDIRNWVVEGDGNWEDDFELDPSERFVETVKTGEFRIKILTAEIRGEGNLRNIIDGLYLTESLTRETLEDLAELINKNAKIELIYTDENLRAAVVRIQVTEDGDDVYIEPVFVFGDGSRITAESFFANPEKYFQKTIDALGKLMMDIMSIFG